MFNMHISRQYICVLVNVRCYPPSVDEGCNCHVGPMNQFLSVNKMLFLIGKYHHTNFQYAQWGQSCHYVFAQDPPERGVETMYRSHGTRSPSEYDLRARLFTGISLRCVAFHTNILDMSWRVCDSVTLLHCTCKIALA